MASAWFVPSLAGVKELSLTLIDRIQWTGMGVLFLSPVE